MQGNSALLQMKSNKDIKGCALNTNALERHISWTGHPMDILWTPYGHPMDTLWTSYGDTIKQKIYLWMCLMDARHHKTGFK
jgi:hypothetical protein